jgi:hypothetical protein
MVILSRKCRGEPAQQGEQRPIAKTDLSQPPEDAMLHRLIAALTAVTLLSVGTPALARGHGGGHSHGGHSYGHSYGGHHSSGHRSSGRISGFRTSKCKSASCFRKHPNGTYVHPLTERKHL